MTKKDFIFSLNALSEELSEQISDLENEFQRARKSIFNKNKKKNAVYENVIDTLADYIEKVQNLATDYATCDILVEDAVEDRVYFSMPIQ